MTLQQWLESFEHLSAVIPMTLEIKGTQYEACSYIARFDTLKGSPAYRNGERQYWRSHIYCLGTLPSCYRRNTQTIFHIDGDPADWYISSYRNYHQSPADKYHPFGSFFQLAPWDEATTGGTIDRYEAVPRKRVPVMIKDLPLAVNS